MTTGRGGLVAALGSVLAAVVASACCWLPLVLLSFGASAAGLSATFDTMRPWFLGVTAVLLGAGFYLIYFRKEKCAPGEACVVPNRKLQRFNRASLWIATIAVATFAFFPNYVGALARSSSIDATGQAEGSMLLVDVEGMTCEACSVHVRSALNDVPGVLDSTVDYEAGLAVLSIDPLDPPTTAALESAGAKVGYPITLTPPGPLSKKTP